MLWTCVAGAADAERKAQAEALFQEGVKAIDANNVAEGCAKLEESERLDPAIGTEFRLADCHERLGRLASAWAAFLELASKVAKPQQVEKARARADALLPRLSRIRLVLPPATATLEGLEILLDGGRPPKPPAAGAGSGFATNLRDGVRVGSAAWGSALPVDPGSHRILATAPGRVSWETTVVVEGAGTTIDVPIPPLRAAETSVGREPAPPLGPARVAALAVGSVGVGGVIVGSALGAAAAMTWHNAAAQCPARVVCPQAAHDLSVKAGTYATGSTAAFIAGPALVVAGIVAWFAGPRGGRPAVTAWVQPAFGPRAGVVGIGASLP
jgi:hypothetical protein